MRKNHKNGPDYNQHTKLTDYNVQLSYMKDYRIQKQRKNEYEITINKKKIYVNRANMIQNQVWDDNTGCRGNIDS